VSIPETIAALDLGSNSFHMVVARSLEGGDIQVLDKLKLRVRLAGGLDSSGHLTDEAEERALAALEQFGQRVRAMPRGSVRAVGTNTLRKLRNPLPFLVRAHKALGHPIEVISGREEARLIYQGVAFDSVASGQRLVVDIGGGSTELIIGEGFEPVALDSLYMGCVSYSLRFFPDGKLTKKAMGKAMTAARLELEPIKRRFRRLGWAEAMGSSGTANAIARILRETGIAPLGITRKGLKRLRRLMLESKRVSDLELPGLSADRRPVIAGGVAILSAVFGALKIQTMTPTSGALREGLLYDIIGRHQGADTREATINRYAERLRVDRTQARRVERTALGLFDQVSVAWKLSNERRSQIAWAARLHEVGMFVTHSGYHKHGAYLIANADLPGFSRQSQGAIAALVLGHRGKLSIERLRAWYPAPDHKLLRQSTLLRLAVRLHRGRSPKSLPEVRLNVSNDSLVMSFPSEWLDENPLTRADLETEAAAVSSAGFSLTFA